MSKSTENRALRTHNAKTRDGEQAAKRTSLQLARLPAWRRELRGPAPRRSRPTRPGSESPIPGYTSLPGARTFPKRSTHFSPEHCKERGWSAFDSRTRCSVIVSFAGRTLPSLASWYSPTIARRALKSSSWASPKLRRLDARFSVNTIAPITPIQKMAERHRAGIPPESIPRRGSAHHRAVQIKMLKSARLNAPAQNE